MFRPNSTIMSAGQFFWEGCLAVHSQYIIWLAMDILYLVEFILFHVVPPMFDPAKILRTRFGGLAGLVLRKICLVWPFLYFVRYTCSFKLTFMRYF